MPGFLLDTSATVNCFHSGQAQPVATSTRVKIDGQPIALQNKNYSISGCVLPSSAGGPCVSAQWTSAALRVKSEGVPVLLQDSQAICTPTGTGLTPANTQTRVKGT